MTPEEQYDYEMVLYRIDWAGPLNLAQVIAHGPWLVANARAWGWEAPRPKREKKVDGKDLEK